MAKKSNLISLGEAISTILKQENLDVRLSRFAVKNGWKEIVGDVIARHTTDIFFRDKTIFITLSSAAMKHELTFSRDTLIENINKFCGYRLVDQIVLR